jgi:N-formylglutamate amidohydrolase
MSVPHGSFLIPEDIRPSIALMQSEILESTDLGTREVFTPLPVRVALWSRWSRLVVDLNRDPQQRDPKGVVPEVDYYGRTIYREESRPSEDEVERRLKQYYWPYHNRLKEAIKDPEIGVLFDCHSLTGIGPPGAPDPLKWRKDIVLGNNGENSGFSASINQPYSGGFITTHYGHELAKEGRMAVQIEINQDLYLDSGRLRLDRNKLADVVQRLQQVFREIARML